MFQILKPEDTVPIYRIAPSQKNPYLTDTYTALLRTAKLGVFIMLWGHNCLMTKKQKCIVNELVLGCYMVKKS